MSLYMLMGFVLTPPPSDEITTLGEALFKRIQCMRGCIVVSLKVLSSPRSSRPPLPGSAKSNLNDLVVPNVSSSQDEKVKSASKEHVEAKKPTNSTHAPFEHPRAAKSDTKLDQQVGVKQ